MIGLGLAALNSMCGVFAMISYMSMIFKEVGSSLTPNMAGNIVVTIQFVGTLLSSYFCDEIGRRYLLIISSAGTCLGLAITGVDMLFFNNHYLNWVPVISISFAIFCSSWGVLTLPFVVISEIMPEKVN